MDKSNGPRVFIITNSEIEYKYIQQTFPGLKSLNERRSEFNLNSWKCDLFRTDPGIFSLTYFLTKELNKQDYDLVVNAGICGSYTHRVEIGSAIRVEADVFGDTGAEDGKTLFDLGLVEKNSFPFQNGELHDKPGNIDKLDQILPTGRGVTVNRVSLSHGNISFLRTKYRPDIESMEGAAFFYVCSQENINYLQIRGVSNVVGERDKSNWEIEAAMVSVGDALKKILQ